MSKNVIDGKLQGYLKRLTAEEIKDAYYGVIEGKEKAFYTALPLKIAALANFKGLTPAFSYGYYYEVSEEAGIKAVVPLALNYIFGYNRVKNDDNGVLITIDLNNLNGNLFIERFGYDTDYYDEISINDFAALFDGIEFNENNIKRLDEFISNRNNR